MGFESLLRDPAAALSVLAPIGFVGFAYFVLTLDRARANSISKDDSQAGVKLVLFGLVIAGVGLAAGGLDHLLAYMLGGFKGGSGPIKLALPSIVVGGLVVLIVAKALLPRTNSSSSHQAERYAMGMLGLQYGVMGIAALDGVLTGLFNDAGWGQTSGSLSSLVVALAVAGFSLGRFGGLSGWTSPAPVAPPPPQQPQYPPQGGGYPPQGGGYPPQGGGYPPQGGGYPPQGGGYPPQGGGYPPQGGYGR